jgi:hypothetical protein
MSKIKDLMASFNGYNIKGTCLVRHTDGTTKWIKMISFYLPYELLTHNRLKRYVNTGGYDKDHSIIEAHISIFRRYGRTFEQFSRTIKLNESQCKNAITKNL